MEIYYSEPQVIHRIYKCKLCKDIHNIDSKTEGLYNFGGKLYCEVCYIKYCHNANMLPPFDENGNVKLETEQDKEPSWKKYYYNRNPYIDHFLKFSKNFKTFIFEDLYRLIYKCVFVGLSHETANYVLYGKNLKKNIEQFDDVSDEIYETSKEKPQLTFSKYYGYFYKTERDKTNETIRNEIIKLSKQINRGHVDDRRWLDIWLESRDPFNDKTKGSNNPLWG